MEEQNKIQRAQAINVLQQKYVEGFRNVQQEFPSLYRQTCIQLRDISKLRILKWIETYEISWRTIHMENTKERRRLIRVVERAYMNNSMINIYGRLAHFTDKLSTLINRSTLYLTTWECKHIRATKVSQQEHGQIQWTPSLEQGLTTMEYYQLYTVFMSSTVEELNSLDSGERDGSSDLLPS